MTEKKNASATAPHDAWVARGQCAAIRWTKAWCNLRASHDGLHMSPRLYPNGKMRKEFWDR